ncbi:MAG: A/G-specific adenine glycosylase [Pseudomonadota bacterium]
MTLFSQRIIDWQKRYGRHDLPWQNTVDPYAIWVSEIMLQQTQVTAVIGYYAKFMRRFPNIQVLASATQEEVLQYWSGLGYYSRARNLHAAAQKIMADFDGVFPHEFDDIQSLSGIGRSTAAAISTFALNLPQPILDGNVKRVFARHFNVSGYTGAPKVAQQLWQIAERENPNQATHAIAYTQGLMDLGATLCTRTKPRCTICPVSISCEALALDLVKILPTPKLRKTVPEKSINMLVLIDQNPVTLKNTVMLEKRPPSGIWGGLWSLPEVASMDGIILQNVSTLNTLTHTFTHFKLHITPQLIYVDRSIPQVNEAVKIWLPIEEAIEAAIPTPIRTILMSINVLTEQNI